MCIRLTRPSERDRQSSFQFVYHSPQHQCSQQTLQSPLSLASAVFLSPLLAPLSDILVTSRLKFVITQVRELLSTIKETDTNPAKGHPNLPLYRPSSSTESTENMPLMPPKAYLSYPRDPAPFDDSKCFWKGVAEMEYGVRRYKKEESRERSLKLFNLMSRSQNIHLGIDLGFDNMCT